MARSWRYLVLVAGLVGIAGFFAPFLEYRAPDGALLGASAYEIATGTPDVASLMSAAEKLGLVDQDEAARATRLLAQGIRAYQTAMLACFAPAALMLLLGLTAFARRQLGRLGGLAAIVFGLGCVAVYVAFFRVESARDDDDDERPARARGVPARGVRAARPPRGRRGGARARSPRVSRTRSPDPWSMR